MTIAEIFTTMTYGKAPESPAAAQAWLDAHDRSFGLFIGNRWAPPRSGRTVAATNPADDSVLAQVADANTDDVHAAVQAARTAFPAWSRLTPHARARHLYAIARAVQKHSRLLSVIESLDNGKSIRESRDLDIPLVARHFYHHAGWAQIMHTDPELRQSSPLGVIGQIVPWNFPLLMLAWKIAPALAMGNTLVIKPAPATSLSALLFGELLAEAGLPPGVVNIVTGGDETGVAITAHPDIDKIAFTGSTEVGRIIRRATAGTGKRLSLELGGKSPFIVFNDADQDAAVEGLVDAIWFNQGQVCCAGSRVLVQESIAVEFLAKVRRRMGMLRIGDPLDKAIDIGAIVDARQRDTIAGWVQRGIDEGGEVYQPPCDLPSVGAWYPPTLITNVQPASAVVQEEIFGPVAVALTFRTPKEAVALANNTRYGLAASIWSENVNLSLDIARRVKAGSVWVNCTNLFDAAAGFGGYRESGYGREGGREGLFEYVRPAHQPRYTARPTLDLKAWGAVTPARPRPLNDGLMADGHQAADDLPPLDRTAKLFINGKQARPDGAYTRVIVNADGNTAGQVGDGNRKDIRDAVEAARNAAEGWASRTGHARAQIVYYLAENLAARADDFARRLAMLTGADRAAADREVTAAVDLLFTYAAYADKYGGTMQETTLRGLTLGVHESIGVIGIAAGDDAPLLSLIALIAPVIGRGNTCVVVPSERYPLIATDLYQVIETSDVPAGVINLVTGGRDHLARTLAEHDNVDAIWYFGEGEAGALGSAHIEYASAFNMKRTHVGYGQAINWYAVDPLEWLREVVQVKNVWLPTGE